MLSAHMPDAPTDIRNVAIIAHVDHGKTTLVDALLRQSGNFRDAQLQGDAILDSNPLERERGITILAKNIAITHTDPETGHATKINVIDTPGHADFGGEVERVLAMADGCLLLVDAAEGPMPQTRFVLQKAFAAGLRPIVVVNKIDKPDARPDDVMTEVFDLFVELGADDETLDFPHVYASGRDGWASNDPEVKGENITPVFDMILNHVPRPTGDPEKTLELRIQTLDYSEYVGRIAVGRVYNGTVKPGQILLGKEGSLKPAKIQQVMTFDGFGKQEVKSAPAGELVALVGLGDVNIGDSVCDPADPKPMTPLEIEPPTLTMIFSVNSSPLAGKEGKYVTGRNIRDRLDKELEKNVALKVEATESNDAFQVSGPRADAFGHPDRDDAARELRAVDRQAAGDREGDRRRAARALGALGDRRARGEAGGGDGAGGQPQGRAAEDGHARRAERDGVPDPRPRADRDAHAAA